MKKQIISAICVLLTISTNAQVTETVTFDNYVSPINNDYHNKFNEFWGATGLVQIIDSGITGGCLRVPNNSLTVSNAERYCSKYRNQIGAVFTTSFSFKWDTTNINTSAGVQNIVELYLHSSQSVTANSYIWAHLSNDKKLHILNWDGGSSSNDTVSTAMTPLIQYHWYNLVLTTSSIGGSFGDKIGVTAQIYELGLSGTVSPTMVNSVTATRSNVPFINDTAIYINVIGAKWAGCSYIDNFIFSGYKSADSCSTITEVGVTPNGLYDFNIYPNPNKGEATINYFLSDKIKGAAIVIRNIDGKIVNRYPVTNRSTSLVVEDLGLPSGIYYYSLVGEGIPTTTKRVAIIK